MSFASFLFVFTCFCIMLCFGTNKVIVSFLCIKYLCNFFMAKEIHTINFTYILHQQPHLVNKRDVYLELALDVLCKSTCSMCWWQGGRTVTVLACVFHLQEKKIFQIPWMHAARHGWDMEKDAPLFRNWAIHTGIGKTKNGQWDWGNGERKGSMACHDILLFAILY